MESYYIVAILLLTGINATLIMISGDLHGIKEALERLSREYLFRRQSGSQDDLDVIQVSPSKKKGPP